MHLFDIFIKKSTVVLDCFTQSNTVYNNHPVQRSINYLPQWWKDLPSDPKTHNEHVGYVRGTNMKKCPGFIEYFNKGITIPLWCDLAVTSDQKNIAWQFVSKNFAADIHGSIQSNNAFNYHHLKLLSPWTIKCKEQIYFLVTESFWNSALDTNFKNNVHCCHGLLEFKHNNASNVNLFFNKVQARYELEAGIPIVQLMPLTEKKIIIRNHHLDPIEASKLILDDRIYFNNFYHRSKKAVEKAKNLIK
jgi:hypothetical protein